MTCADLIAAMPALNPYCVRSSGTTTFGAANLRLPDVADTEAYRTCIDAARRGELQPNTPYLRNCRTFTVQPTSGAKARQDETPPFALNSRETAVLVWGALFLAWSFGRIEVRRSFGAVLGSLFGSFLIWLVVAALAYNVFVVLLLVHFGYWEAPMTKTTTWWFLGTATTAIFANTKSTTPYFRGLVVDNL